VITRALWRGAVLGAIVLLAASPLEAQTTKMPITVQASEMHPMTVTMLLVKIQRDFELAIVPDKFNRSILETLRKVGYNVVGAENVLFAVDKSSDARMLLGGTISNVQRHRRLPGNVDFCDIAILWELFDKGVDQVVYKRLTRHRIAVSKSKPLVTDADVNSLVQGALASLLASPRFVEAVMKAPGSADVPVSIAPATYRACSAVPRSLPTEIDAVIAASVSIPAFGGAGVFISPDGVLVTAEHVVSGLDEIVVKLRDGRSLPGRVVRRDPARDIAVVRVQGAPESCVPIAAAWPESGAEVFAIGAPLAEELAFSVSRGIVSGTPTIDGRKVIQTDASINPGNSGGPLVDERGRLLGIVQSKLVRGDVEGIAFAVHADTALVWLGLSAGETTTLEKAATVKSAIAQATIEDTADPPLKSPAAAALERNRIIEENERQRSREELPAKVAVGFGGVLTFGSIIPLGYGAALFRLGAPRTSAGLFLAAGVAALTGGVVLFIVGHYKFKKIALKRAEKVAFGVAPLDAGRGAAFVLGGRF